MRSGFEPIPCFDGLTVRLLSPACGGPETPVVIRDVPCQDHHFQCLDRISSGRFVYVVFKARFDSPRRLPDLEREVALGIAPPFPLSSETAWTRKLLSEAHAVK